MFIRANLQIEIPKLSSVFHLLTQTDQYQPLPKLVITEPYTLSYKLKRGTFPRRISI